tara:strand:- start:3539 stop:4705 length:1167 start_codon:yes stop_codon:yes gene_type:complete
VISYSKQFIDKSDVDYVKRSLDKDFITQGPLIEKFEKKLCKFFKSNYCIAVSSGTAGLHLSGMALGWNKDDLILLSANTFVATANAAIYSKAKINLIDIDPETNNIDVYKLEKEIKRNKKKGINISAVVATDYGGHPCYWQELNNLKKKYKFKLVNDNCHSIGSTINRNIGYAVKYSDMVVHSYHPVKAFTTGEGGSILTNNKKYYEFLKKARSHGIVRDYKAQKSNGSWYYDIKSIGYNYRLSEINAALGISQLNKLKQTINKRRLVAKKYNKLFKDLDFFDLPVEKHNYKHSYHLYVLKFDFEKYKISKKHFFEYMLKKNIKLQVHYVPLYKFTYFKNKFKFNKKNYKNCEKFYKSAFSIPNFYEITNKQIEYVSFEIKKYFLNRI